MTLDGIDEATLNKILTLIELQFGSKCEVVLHDLTKPYDHTIVDIRNGYITGRKVGDCGSNLGLEVMRGTVKNGDRYNYITHTRDGKILRSSSIYFYDENGTATAALCLNLDITETIKFEEFLSNYNQYQFAGSDTSTHEVFASNVSELLEHLLSNAEVLVGKPFAQMDRNEKIKAVEYLDAKGALLISKSSEKICEALNISKFTLYNYLDILRGNKDSNNNKGVDN